MQKKILPHILALTILSTTVPLGWTQSQSLSKQPPTAGPVSLEPAVEKEGVRVALRTSIQRKNELAVLVKISNLSEQPILVSPDAVEATTEEGFVMKLAGTDEPNSSHWGNSPQKPTTWSRWSEVAALVPFADPYHIISSTKAIADFAKKNKS